MYSVEPMSNHTAKSLLFINSFSYLYTGLASEDASFLKSESSTSIRVGDIDLRGFRNFVKFVQHGLKTLAALCLKDKKIRRQKMESNNLCKTN